MSRHVICHLQMRVMANVTKNCPNIYVYTNYRHAHEPSQMHWNALNFWYKCTVLHLKLSASQQPCIVLHCRLSAIGASYALTPHTQISACTVMHCHALCVVWVERGAATYWLNTWHPNHFHTTNQSQVQSLGTGSLGTYNKGLEEMHSRNTRRIVCGMLLVWMCCASIFRARLIVLQWFIAITCFVLSVRRVWVIVSDCEWSRSDVRERRMLPDSQMSIAMWVMSRDQCKNRS